MLTTKKKMINTNIPFQNAQEAEAYANLMRQLPSNEQNIDQEDEKEYESVADIQDLLAEINQT